jgi:uncharacterized protein YqgC (DUF456 family)
MPASPGMIAVDVVVGLLFIAGLAGAVVPFLPGPLLILAGAFVYAAATGFSVLGAGRLVVLGILTAAGWSLAHFAAVLGARRYGGSRWAGLGALVGAIVGMVLGPLGLVIGPAMGAIVFELAATQDLEGSVRGGVGAVVGVAVGVVAHFSIAAMMIALFLWWVWRG